MIMKRLGLWGGLGLACAACCAAPFLAPVALVGAAGLTGLLTRHVDILVCAAIALGVAAFVLLARRRPAKPASCQADGSCGCGPKP